MYRQLRKTEESYEVKQLLLLPLETVDPQFLNNLNFSGFQCNHLTNLKLFESKLGVESIYLK